jgi:MFS family permease
MRVISLPTLVVPFLGVLASLQLIDPIVANTALVRAGVALNLQGSTFALAATISTLAQAATVLLMGLWGDRYGRRRMLIVSLCLSISGGLIAMLAPGAALFLLGRSLAGIGVGAVLVLSFATVRFVSEPDELGRALGVWNLLIIVGFSAGSLFGGMLADISWRLAFALVPLIAATCIPAVHVLLPDMPANQEIRADWPGLISIAAAMVFFLAGVSQAGNGVGSAAFIVPSLVGTGLFVVHVLIERVARVPIFPLNLYSRGCFSAAIVSGFAWNFAQAAVQLQTSSFWQVVQGFSTTQVAFAQLPVLICFGFGGVLVGRLMKPGPRTTQLMAVGFSGLVAGLLLMARIQAETNYLSLLGPLLLVGSGLALISVPQSALFVQEAPPRYFGTVTAFRTTTGQLGFALGFAASAAMVNGFGFASLRDRLLKLGASGAQIPGLEAKLRAILSSGDISQVEGASSKALEFIGQSYASGLAGTMIVVAVVVGLLGAISLLLLVNGHQEGRHLA